ncbi:GNAT family N-acetyltransferase [Flagellimonas flava]|uniref:Acetyltransferase (GNAT) domain-containing protein n=1 Tax=Flagellimonas flava TaxID=570519 RepID=A0A1M5IVJ8_9FLAO|nr:GNAT family N-acetyltransferase [Allomuricauda flava]SHG32358.1 Acetyltransferase (GNAT) domain-containing protein [Allomuricauda flava]
MRTYISSDKTLLDVDKIHDAIKSSYWGGYRTLEMTQKTIDSSICFGIYNEDDVQLGFGRVLTDGVVFAYIMDVIIFNGFRGKGLGKMLTQHILEYPEINKVHTVALKTMDAHGLYQAYGFEKVGDSKMWMAKDNATYDIQ